VVVISQVIAELQRLEPRTGDKPVLLVDEKTGEQIAFTIEPGIGTRKQGMVVLLKAVEVPQAQGVQGQEGVPWPTRTG
jgi:hypothetical protein